VALAGSGLPLAGLVAYLAISMLMINDFSWPLLPPPLGAKVQLSEVIFPLAIAPWLLTGLSGLARVAWLAGMPAGIWVAANAATAAAAVAPGHAWRETAAFAYLGVVLVWSAAILAEPSHLRSFVRWWTAVVAGVVVIGLAGWLLAVLSGQPNVLVEWRHGVPLLGDRARIRSTLAPTSRLLVTLLIVALPAALVLRRQGTAGERRWAGWLIVAMTVCAILTYARGLLEYLLLLGLLSLLPWVGRRRVAAVALAAIYALAILGVVAVSTWRVTGRDVTWHTDLSRSLSDGAYYGTMPDVGIQTLNLRVEWVHDHYFILKRIAWRAFVERPLTGWGPDTWLAIQAWAKAIGIAPPYFRYESAHGEVLAVLAEMGVVGLGAFAAFWTLILRNTWPRANARFAATLAHYQALGIVAVLFTTLYLDVMRFRFLWIALALGIGASCCTRARTA
jgi:O-Antigen ligase